MAVRRDETKVELLTPEQAAEALGIGRWKLYDLLRQGRLRVAAHRQLPPDLDHGAGGVRRGTRDRAERAALSGARP